MTSSAVHRPATSVAATVLAVLALAACGAKGSSSPQQAAATATSSSVGPARASASPSSAAVPQAGASPVARKLASPSATEVLGRLRGYTLRRSTTVEQAVTQGYEKHPATRPLVGRLVARQVLEGGRVVGVVVVAKFPERYTSGGVRDALAGAFHGATVQGGKPERTTLLGRPAVVSTIKGERVWNLFSPSYLMVVAGVPSAIADDLARQLLTAVAADY